MASLAGLLPFTRLERHKPLTMPWERACFSHVAGRKSNLIARAQQIVAVCGRRTRQHLRTTVTVTASNEDALSGLVHFRWHGKVQLLL